MMYLKLLKPNEELNGNSVVVVDFRYSPEYVQAVKSIEPRHRKFNPDKKNWWILAGEVPKLAEKVGLYNLTFNDARLRNIFVKREENKKQKHIDDVQNRLKDVKQKYNYTWKTNPFPHQIEGFNEGMSKRYFLLGDEQGLGKTVTSLAIAEARHQMGIINKCLIVCGVNSTKYNWGKEIEKYTNEKYVVIDQKAKVKTHKGEKTTLLTAEESKVKTIEEWANSDVFFAIVNIELLRPDCKWTEKVGGKNYKTGNQKALDNFIFNPYNGCHVERNKCMEALAPIIKDNMVIVDEIHKCKNIIGSRQGVALQQLNSHFKIGLSGTPITNKVMDLWNILVWLKVEYRSYYAFRSEYCTMGGYNNKEVVGYKNLESLNKKLNEVMLRRKKEEVLNLPDKIYHTEYVDLTSAQKKMYRDTRNGLLKIMVEDATFMFKTDEALVQLIRLRQITDGVFGDTKDNAKLNRVKELVEEIVESGNKAIIFSNFESTTEIYKNELKEYNPAYIVGATDSKKRQKEVDRFQNDKSCKLIIGTVGAMGTGLTLTAASYVFFIDKYWNPSENMQAEDRAHRIGTKKNVTIISMIAKNTIDERIEELVGQKEATASAVVDGVSTFKEIPTGRELVETLIAE